jgi:hypothetical protein
MCPAKQELHPHAPSSLSSLPVLAAVSCRNFLLRFTSRTWSQRMDSSSLASGEGKIKPRKRGDVVDLPRNYVCGSNYSGMAGEASMTAW